MDNNLKELIEMATVSGSLSNEHESLILEKANAQGISETEIRLYIDAALRKNSSNSNSNYTQNNTFSTDNFSQKGFSLNFKDFALPEWLIVLGILVTAIAGFFPWVNSSVRSGGFGYSYSGGASVGGGFFYSIPLATSAFFIFYRKSLQKYLIYEGIGIIFISIALYFSYSSKVTGGGGGISAIATTNAGTGVYVLLIGGVIYTIGAMLQGKNATLNTSFLKYLYHPLAAVILIAFLLLVAGINKLNLNEKNLFLFIAAIIWGGLPYYLARKKGFKRFETIAISTIFVFALSILIPRNSDYNIIINLSEAFYIVGSWYFVMAMIIGLIALFADFQNLKSKTYDIIEKINPIFNFKIISGTFIVLFLGMFIINMFTKHRITNEEINAFNERNGKIQGEWYFISEDTSKIYTLNLNYINGMTTDDGDINFKFTAYLSSDDYKFEEINNQELNDKKDYKYDLQFPLEFDKGLKINSNNEDKIDGNYILNGTKFNFSAFRNEDFLRQLIEEKKQLLNNNLEEQIENVEIDQNSNESNTKTNYFKIQDTDGFTNLRDKPNGSIIKKVLETEYFIIIEDAGDFFKVRLSDGNEGYLHKSRVIPVLDNAN